MEIRERSTSELSIPPAIRMRTIHFAGFVCASLKIVEGRGVSGSEISTQVKRPQSHSEDAEQFTRELEHVLQ